MRRYSADVDLNTQLSVTARLLGLSRTHHTNYQLSHSDHSSCFLSHSLFSHLSQQLLQCCHLHSLVADGSKRLLVVQHLHTYTQRCCFYTQSLFFVCADASDTHTCMHTSNCTRHLCVAFLRSRKCLVCMSQQLAGSCLSTYMTPQHNHPHTCHVSSAQNLGQHIHKTLDLIVNTRTCRLSRCAMLVVAPGVRSMG